MQYYLINQNILVSLLVLCTLKDLCAPCVLSESKIGSFIHNHLAQIQNATIYYEPKQI